MAMCKASGHKTENEAGAGLVSVASSEQQAIQQPNVPKPDAPSAVSKTESPHGLLSDRLPAEVDPPCGEVFIILTDYDCGHAYHLREVSRARTHDS